MLSLVKVSGKSHSSAKTISTWRTLDSSVLLSFSGFLLTALAGLTHCLWTGKHQHPLPMAPGQLAAKKTLLQP